MHVSTLCDWVSSSASACDSDRGPCVRKLLTGLIMYIYPLKIKNIVLYCIVQPSFHSIVNDGVVRRIRTLFSLVVKFYPSDYDSDSYSDFASSENQPVFSLGFWEGHEFF